MKPESHAVDLGYRVVALTDISDIANTPHKIIDPRIISPSEITAPQ
jgi:hypothetical protein